MNGKVSESVKKILDPYKRRYQQQEMLFEYCPSCGGDLDTGWECNSCNRDWRPWAYPWWERIKDRVIRGVKS